MKFFMCWIDGVGQGMGISASACESLLLKRGLQPRWKSWKNLVVLTTRDCLLDDIVTRKGDWIAIGNVRLDNRAEIKSWLESVGSRGDGYRTANDLGLVLGLVSAQGTKYVPKILGDFCFVAWNLATYTGLAACDAFAVKPLYYTLRKGVMSFASQSEALAQTSKYNVQYLVERVAYCNPITPGSTVYSGVYALPAATLATLENGKIQLQKYWSAASFSPIDADRMRKHDARLITRELLTQSVRLRLEAKGGNWAQLSGGLDSSGVVSIAQGLFQAGQVEHGLDGALTYVDRPEVFDKDILSARGVAAHWGIRNDQLVGIPRWHSSNHRAPLTDYPDGWYSVFPRDMQARRIMALGAARTLLTGLGGDELFSGNRFYYADLVAMGNARRAIAEVAHRAVVQRRSFWGLLRKNIILPFIPKRLVRRLSSRREIVPLPQWYQKGLFHRCDVLNFGGPFYWPKGREREQMYHREHIWRINSLVGRGGWQVLGQTVDVRHPFLYRPLVEFALELPATFCMDPCTSKPLLRAAMRGIVPELTSRSINPHFESSAGSSSIPDGGVLENLTRNSILAELGIVHQEKLRMAVAARGHMIHGGGDYMDAVLDQTLEVEGWLQQRSGRSRMGAPGRSKGKTRVELKQLETTPLNLRATIGGVS